MKGWNERYLEEGIAHWNGQFVRPRDIWISPLDRGLLWGDAVYDVLRTFGHQPFKLREHIERLGHSLRYTGIDPGLRLEELERVAGEIVDRNRHLLRPHDDIHVRIHVTRGPNPVSASLSEAGPPTVLVFCEGIGFSGFARQYLEGAPVVIVGTRRIPTQCLSGAAKISNKMNYYLAEREAKQVDPAAYAVLLELDGTLAESTSSNIFLVRGGRILTPEAGSILRGVSRQTVFELAASLGIPCAEARLQPYDLLTADEAFLTNTSISVLPVVRVNGTPIGTGKPGPVVGRLLQAWSALVGVDIVAQALAHLPPLDAPTPAAGQAARPASRTAARVGT